MIFIHVKQKHIDAGERSSCGNCPVARAVEERTGSGCSLTEDRMILFDADGYYERDMRTPEVVVAFIHAFDKGEPVEPFRFQLP